jgi:hypothetical protein
MKVGDVVKFPGSYMPFATIIKENNSEFAMMFKDGDIRWIKKETLDTDKRSDEIVAE